MPAAVVGGIIAGAGSLGAAAIASHSAGKAADQQVEAGDKAIALQRDIYNQQQANEAPWRNTGAAAITTLGGLLGLPSAPGGGGTGQLPASGSTALGGNTPWGGTVMDGGGGAITDPSKAPDATYGMHGDYIGGQTTQQDRARMPTASSYNSAQTYGSAPQATGMDMVTMVAPDGTRQQVPRSQAGHYTQMGAKVVG